MPRSLRSWTSRGEDGVAFLRRRERVEGPEIGGERVAFGFQDLGERQDRVGLEFDAPVSAKRVAAIFVRVHQIADAAVGGGEMERGFAEASAGVDLGAGVEQQADRREVAFLGGGVERGASGLCAGGEAGWIGDQLPKAGVIAGSDGVDEVRRGVLHGDFFLGAKRQKETNAVRGGGGHAREAIGAAAGKSGARRRCVFSGALTGAGPACTVVTNVRRQNPFHSGYR